MKSYVSVQYSHDLFALNQRDILLIKITFISEKGSSTFMPERNKLVLSASMTGFTLLEHPKRSFT